jgi:hypothetical protein
MALFPAVFSQTSKSKYNDLATWLAAKHGVVTSSLRDLFSAGGKRSFKIDGVWRELPRIFGHAADDYALIQDELKALREEELLERWNVPVESLALGRLTIWLGLVQEQMKGHRLGFQCSIKQILGI